MLRQNQVPNNVFTSNICFTLLSLWVPQSSTTTTTTTTAQLSILQKSQSNFKKTKDVELMQNAMVSKQNGAYKCIVYQTQTVIIFKRNNHFNNIARIFTDCIALSIPALECAKSVMIGVPRKIFVINTLLKLTLISLHIVLYY